MRSLLHDLSQAQEPGTDPKLLFCRGFHVDLNAHLAGLDTEIRNPTVGGKIIGFADGQESTCRKFGQDGAPSFALGSGEHQDLAAPCLADLRKMPDDEPPIVDRLAVEFPIQRAAEWAVTQDATGNWIRAVLERVGRPFDELCEII